MTPIDYVRKNFHLLNEAKNGLYEKVWFQAGEDTYSLEHWFAKKGRSWQLFSFRDCSAPWYGASGAMKALKELKYGI